MSARYRLKRRSGFFAAGVEFERALGELGDGAFKLYAHVCLQAERASGRLVFDRAALARRLGKSRNALGRHLRELVRAGVCDLETAPNQHRGSVLAVRDAYWPYRAASAAPPVRSLAYFEPLLREVERERFPAAYWQHLEFNLRRCEDYWQHRPDHAPLGACPNLEQAAGRRKAPAHCP